MSTDLSSKKTPDKTLGYRILKSLLVIFGTAGLFFVGQVLGVFFLYTLLTIFGVESSRVESLITENSFLQFGVIFVIAAITLGLLWLVYKARNLNFLSSVSISRRPRFIDFGKALLAYIVYFITLISVVGLISIFVPAIDVDQAQQIGFDDTSGIGILFVFLALVIVVPIMEEVVFRGFLFQRLKGLIKFWPAAIISSVIFALAHTEFLGDNPLNWIAAVDTLILSFFLIYLLHKTGSLWGSIMLHSIKNFIAFVVLFII